jgi:hypothetical protein
MYIFICIIGKYVLSPWRGRISLVVVGEGIDTKKRVKKGAGVWKIPPPPRGRMSADVIREKCGIGKS